MLTPLRLTRLRRVASLAVHPDGRWLAVAVARLDVDDAAYVHDLFCVPVDGGEAVCLTPGPWNDRSPAFRSDGTLLFLSNRPIRAKADEGETERSQIWALSDHGEATRVTDEPLGVEAFACGGGTVVALAPRWPGVAPSAQRSHRRDVVDHGPSVLRYTRPPVRWWDRWEPFTRLHLVVLADDGTMRDLAPPKGLVLRQDPELALSADGTRVAHTCLREGERRLPLQAVQVRSTDDGRVLFERGVEGATGYGQLRLDATGHRLAVQRRIVHADRVTEKQLLIVEADGERRLDDGWDRWAAPEAFLDDGRLLVSFDDGGETRLALVAEDGTREELDLDGHHGGVKTAGRVIAGIGDGLKRPPRPFVLEGGARRWLAELSGVAEDELPFRVERLGVEASDGATVDCRLVLPPGDGPFPCLLWIHGGPVGYFGDQWHWRWCAGVMAAAGYAVALPNARGSTGYGVDFVNGIHGNRWGERCFDDLMRVADALETRDAVDATKMVAMGGSFGGYMTNWIGGQTDRFRALVTHASIFDLRAFGRTTDVPPYFATQNVDPDSPEVDRYSPHAHLAEWKTPTLILHGALDYRVPVTEALALFDALHAHGVDSELVVFPDENHWIRKPRNIRAWYGAVFDFLEAALEEPGGSAGAA